MNNPPIIKIEFRLNVNDSYTDLDVIPYSGNITQVISDSMAGVLATITVDFRKENWNTEHNATLNSLVGRKAQYRITDANDNKHVLGDAVRKAKLLYQSKAGGAATSFNGYECTIQWLSPEPISIE